MAKSPIAVNSGEVVGATAPSEPVDIPEEAFTALQGPRDAIVDIIPQQLDFAIGIKQVNGEYQDDLALIVLIPDKLPRDQVPPGQLIPSDFGGFVTDVVQFQPEEITDSSVHDPLLGGIQISRPAMTAPDGVSLVVHAAMLGAIAQNRSDGALLMLTNSHVLPDAGVDVHQPSDLTAGGDQGCTRTLPLSDQADGSDTRMVHQ